MATINYDFNLETRISENETDVLINKRMSQVNI